MKPADRIVAALEGRKTDRIPTLSLLADPNIANQVTGRKPFPVLSFLKSPVGSRLLDRQAARINRLADLGVFGVNDLGARINFEMGFDAFMPCYWRFQVRNSREAQDVFGRAWNIVDDGHGNPYLMYNRGLLKTPEQWRQWPLPEVASYATRAARMYRVLRYRWGEKIALVPLVGPGIWENAWQPIGFPEWVVLLRRDPGFAREVIRYYTTLTVAMVESYCHAGAPAICYGDDLAYKSGPMLSPKQLAELLGDACRQITATAHRLGRPIFIHSCGNSTQLLPLFQEWGFDGAHAFEPTAGNDLAAARSQVGSRFCLVGNIDVSHILTEAERGEVEQAVSEAIRKASGGGFILAPAHSHGDIRVRNVLWMLEAALRRGATG